MEQYLNQLKSPNLTESTRKYQGKYSPSLQNTSGKLKKNREEKM